MKYLNTCHLELLGSYGSAITSADGFIKGTSAINNDGRNVFSIPVHLSNTVCFSFNCPYNGSYYSSYNMVAMRFLNVAGLVGFSFSGTTSRISKVTYGSYDMPQRTNLWTGSAPLNTAGERLVHVRVDISTHTLDMYVNGELIVENLDYQLDPTTYYSTISELQFGHIDNGYPDAVLSFNNFIISDSAFPPTERVVEVTPTITTTDWTVTDGVATTNTVGDEMTLTVPSGAIDESVVKLTGYTVGLLDSAPSEDVNAVAVTQGSTTDTVVLPSGSTQSAYFTVSQASAISASVVARSVTV